MTEFLDIRYDRERRILKRAAEDRSFRAKLLTDPRAALAEAYDVRIAPAVRLEVVEEQPGSLVFVLPQAAPDGVDLYGELSDRELESVAGGKGDTYKCDPSHQKTVVDKG